MAKAKGGFIVLTQAYAETAFLLAGALSKSETPSGNTGGGRLGRSLELGTGKGPT